VHEWYHDHEGVQSELFQAEHAGLVLWFLLTGADLPAQSVPEFHMLTDRPEQPSHNPRLHKTG
jgi:hypothetical protein